MKNKKSKKILLNIFAIIQILFLVLGNVSPAAAVWTSLRDEDSDDLPSGVKDNSEYEVVSSYKKNDMVPRVSVVFSPSNPKVGEEVTATAVAAAFANDTDKLYFTWFLKRKDCEITGTERNDYAVSSENYDPDDNYPSHARLVTLANGGDEDAEKAVSCDVDEDGMITVNDWKIDAMRRVAQNGFKPDLGGKYERENEAASQEAFYADDTDNDGHYAWQGGADAERMPNHCYGYDATSGVMFEFIDQYLRSVPVCPSGEPAVCGNTIQYTTDAATADACYCSLPDTEGNPNDHDAPCNCTDVNGNGTLIDAGDCEVGDNMTLDLVDPTVIPPTTISCHQDCSAVNYQTACQASSITPRCAKVENPRASAGNTYADNAPNGTFVAVCGPDSDKDGLDDNVPPCGTGGSTRCSVRTTDGTSRMAAFCPTTSPSRVGDDPFNIDQTSFNSLVASGMSFGEEEYYPLTGVYGDFENMPTCSCDRAQIYLANPAGNDETPYSGSSDDPLCEDRSPEIEDLLCSSLTLSSRANTDIAKKGEQFHVFPQRSPFVRGSRTFENYYSYTRDYNIEDNENNERFRYRKGNNTGDNKFVSEDEEFWGTDPRNPSTAGNAKSDEANVAGLGATEFTWEYQIGDEVGVAVEGTSNLGTKFPDSSRMIMWAFSKGLGRTTSNEDSADAACQPKYSGIYVYEDWVNMHRIGIVTWPDFVEMPTGFMDFDRCIEKSTVPLVAGGGTTGAQPQSMEIELDVSPTNPVNDETGEEGGDVVDVRAIVSGATNPTSDLNFSWKIQRFNPGINGQTGLTIPPSDSDWKKGDSTGAQGPEAICGEGLVCPLSSGDGGKIKTKGIGLEGIDFALNLENDNRYFNSNGDGYLRVTVEARETDDLSSPPNSRVGNGEVVIKFTSNQNRIQVFRPEVVGGKLSATGLEPICTSPEERNVCPVTKNEIIGLVTDPEVKGTGDTHNETLVDFDWFANGRTLQECNKAMSESCQDDKQVEYAFFPVTGNTGDTFTVGVRANNIAGKEGQTGKKVELTQKFKVVDPAIKIVPDGSGVWKKKIGSFVDPTKDNSETGKYQDDFSESILETGVGNNVALKLQYIPEYIEEAVSAENWLVDGVASTNHQFTAGALGTIHNVSAGVSYAQSTKTYKALKDLFDVSPAEMTSRNIAHSVQVEVNKEAGATALKNPVRFMANLLSKLPQQVLFFLRLTLSIAVVLLLTGTIFSIFPAAATYGEKRSF